MKILFVTYDFPYPLSSGGKIRAYQMIKGLSREHQITLFSYVRQGPAPEAIAEMKKYCREIRLFLRGKVWSPYHFLRAGFSLLPGTIAHYESSALKKALITGVKDGACDVVHFESYYTALYLPEVASLGVPTVMGNENVEYQIYERFIKSLPFYLWPLRLPLQYDLWKMRRFEEALWQMATVNVVLSEEDAVVMEKAVGRTCPLVPNGADVESLAQVQPKAGGRPTIIFIGNLKYLQNDLGIKKFLRETLPLIRKETPGVVFKLVTVHQPRWLRNLPQGVEVIRDAKTSFSRFASQADVMVNPVEIKGGTRIKLLEALAAGLPVVTARSSLAGFSEIVPERDLLVADTSAAFSQAVTRLLRNSDLRDKIRENGRRVVADNYDWEKSMAKLLVVYSQLNHHG